MLNSNESSIEIANQSFEIDQLLAMHSGTLSKNQKEPTILIASKPVAHAKLLIQSSTFDRDILRPTWIAVCIQAHAVVPPAPKSVLFTQILKSPGLPILIFSPPPPPPFSLLDLLDCRHYLHMSSEVSKRFAVELDKFGDSYYDAIAEDDLKVVSVDNFSLFPMGLGSSCRNRMKRNDVSSNLLGIFFCSYRTAFSERKGYNGMKMFIRRAASSKSF